MTDRLHQLGPYHIHSELGRGAMGVVYRARREGLDRDVALKVLPIGSTEELAARFRREAQLAARLRHPNVVGVHNVGEDAGRLYLAMDLIEGVALDTFLEEERFTAVQAAQLLVKLADAVGHAHQEGVLHRDIKPGNILLGASEKGVGVSQDTGIVPYLADFGLARAIDTAGSEKLSRSGSVLGTPAYMSPEQAQGADIDGRTDLWALGVVGYELVSNRTPFQGDSAMQMLGQVCSHDPPPLRKVAPDVPRTCSGSWTATRWWPGGSPSRGGRRRGCAATRRSPPRRWSAAWGSAPSPATPSCCSRAGRRRRGPPT
ncbi:MAG: serine/threonine-protein kinase [Planctomycetota bacterium]